MLLAHMCLCLACLRGGRAVEPELPAVLQRESADSDRETVRQWVHTLREEGQIETAWGPALEGFLIALIVANVVAVALETIPSIGARFHKMWRMLKRQPLFRGFDIEVLNAILEVPTASVILEQAHITVRGRDAAEMFLVVSGLAHVEAAEGTDISIGPGSTIGAEAFLSGTTYQHTVTAECEMRVLAFPGDDSAAPRPQISRPQSAVGRDPVATPGQFARSPQTHGRPGSGERKAAQRIGRPRPPARRHASSRRCAGWNKACQIIVTVKHGNQCRPNRAQRGRSRWVPICD